MKTLKSTILGIGLLTLAQTTCGLTKVEIIENLKKVHVITFITPSKSDQSFDLFKNRLDFSKWNTAIKDLEIFVKENAQEEKKLITELNEIIKQNNELMNTIKISYNSLFAPTTGTIQPNVVEKNLAILKTIQKAMEESQKKLKGTTLFLQKKKDAREVLVEFAQMVFNTAQQAHNDIDKKTGRQYGTMK